MTKEQYLQELKRYLRKLPQKDYEEAIEYFNEYLYEMDENITEEELIKELGTPKEAAREIIANLLDKKVEYETQEKKRHSNTLWVACLAILLSPIAAPLLIVLLAVLFCVIIVIAVIIFCIFIFGVCGLAIGGKLILSAIVAIPFSTASAFIIGGLGILGIGCFILLCTLVMFLFTCLKALVIKLAQKIARK